MADEGGGVHAAQPLPATEKAMMGASPSGALVGELLVEGHVAVAVDGREHGPLPPEAKRLICRRWSVVLVIEGRVLLGDVVRGHALGTRKGAQDLVGRAREHVVGTSR